MNAPLQRLASNADTNSRTDTATDNSLGQTPAPQGSLASMPLASLADLVPWSGVAAKAGSQELALFYLPGQSPELYAVSHRDPATGAAVIAHGLIGESQGEFYVASPLHKQQYRLSDGCCLNDPTLSLQVYPVYWQDDRIWLMQYEAEQLPQTG